MLEVGDKVPSFDLLTQSEEKITNQDLEGKKVVLYFYPKDDTPGCTKESCNLRDNYHALQDQGYTVLGASPDSPARHVKFIAKYDLPFDLISDPEHSLAEAFGVWVEKNMYGRKYMGIARTTFIIEDGTITEVIKKVKTSDHAAQILD